MSRRVDVLDSLRGLAILGTLGTNIWIFSSAGGVVTFLLGDDHNRWLEQLSLFFTNGKFLGMLTILFGVGLEIQYQASRRRNQPWLWPYVWRSLLLLLDGFLHYLLVVEVDILMGYAVTAIVAAFIVSKPEAVLRRWLWGAGLLHAAAVTLLTLALFAGPAPSASDFPLVQEATRVYTQGSYLEQVAYRWENFALLRLEALFVIPMSLCLFLAGVLLWRAGVFRPEGAALRRRLMGWGLGLGVPLNALTLIPGQVGWNLELPARYLFAPVMALGYIGLFTWLLGLPQAGRAAAALAKLGRVALSAYMLQNIIAMAVFYGWGLGLAGDATPAQTLLVWLAISAFLLVWAAVWLRFFSAGPFEWVWRRLSALALPREARRGE